MIKKVFHLADIHIPNSEDKLPFMKMLKRALSEIAKEASKYNREEIRIVVTGDIFCHKIRTSNEAIHTFVTMLNYLDAIGKTIIIAGNHDMLMNNLDRLDSISPVFAYKKAYDNVIYADKTLNYKSGIIEDDNIIWAVFSSFEDFNPPFLENIKTLHPDKTIVGLFHGDVVGSRTDIGRVSEIGLSLDTFKDCDCVMAGHIHRYQTLRKNGVPFVYAGSLFQKDIGENVSGHGYVLWNMEDLSYEHKEVPNDYSTYVFNIESYEDVKEDIEKVINL